MFNIEMYGFSDRTALIHRKTIKKFFEGKSYQNDYVVTVIPVSVFDHHDTSRPFIRLAITPSDELEDIISELKKLEVDIQILFLPTSIHS